MAIPKKILQDVLKDIKPSPQEEKESKERIGKVIARIQKLLPETKVVLGGSGEKGTWLRQAHDADVFVLFKKGKTGLSEILEKKLRKEFKLTRLHGSRDYFQTKIDGFTFEIVPIIAIKKSDEAENTTDVSPLHASWVKKHKKHADGIRLTKQFFKAAGAYGAESHISGFSGYICEVLTVFYKGFPSLVKGVSSWKPKTIIDVEGHHKGKIVLFEIDKSKTAGPLVVVDPVQKTRNAAAAVSLEKYQKIISHAKAFLNKPSREAFTVPKLDKKTLAKRAGKDELFFIEAVPAQGKIDVVGCQLLKVHEHFLQQLAKHEFTVRESGWAWEGNALYYYIVKKEKRTPDIVVRGPPVAMKKHAERFRKAHAKTFEEKGAVYAKEKREYSSASALIRDALACPHVLERVKKVELK